MFIVKLCLHICQGKYPNFIKLVKFDIQMDENGKLYADIYRFKSDYRHFWIFYTCDVV